jgi:quercetin dioxygenase-like cupin family protein
MRTVSPAVSLACALCASLTLPAQAAGTRPPGAIGVRVGEETWKAAPPNMPAGVQMAVLEGDPRQPGLFTLRLKAPAGTRLAPHTHPVPERVTVISGSIGVGFGTWSDPSALTVYRPGDFYVNPPGAPHYIGFPEDAVVQVTGEGPWALDFLPPPAADAPR